MLGERGFEPPTSAMKIASSMLLVAEVSAKRRTPNVANDGTRFMREMALVELI